MKLLCIVCRYLDAQPAEQVLYFCVLKANAKHEASAERESRAMGLGRKKKKNRTSRVTRARLRSLESAKRVAPVMLAT